MINIDTIDKYDAEVKKAHSVSLVHRANDNKIVWIGGDYKVVAELQENKDSSLSFKVY